MHRCADLYNPVKFTHFNEKNIILILKQLVKVADKWSYELSQEWLFSKLILGKVKTDIFVGITQNDPFARKITFFENSFFQQLVGSKLVSKKINKDLQK